MPRKPREKSSLGIYHVMLRGINKQDIFFDEDDYMCMTRVLADAPTRKDKMGKVVAKDDCTIYAYCILPNHLHLLIKEGNRSISELMKKIEDRYVFFYNTKYERTGHLFQDRFRSEPVNDYNYFRQLLRYIHRNPVKALLCTKPEQYPYSSWKEYLEIQDIPYMVVSKNDVLEAFDRDFLIEWVNTDEDDDCLDMDKEKFFINDNQAYEMMKEISSTSSIEEFRQLSADLQIEYIKVAIQKGLSMRKASRISSLSLSKIQRTLSKED